MRVRLPEFRNSVIQYLSVRLISNDRGLTLRPRLYDHYVALSLGLEHVDLPPDERRVHDLLGGGRLLDDDLRVDYGVLVDLGQVDLQEHQARAVRVRGSQLLAQLGLEGGPDEGAVRPVLGRGVVARLLEDEVGRDASEEGFVVEARELVEQGELVFDELVLEGDVETEL